jgi:hypothetical protein
LGRFIRTTPFSVNRQRVPHVFVDIRFRDHHSAEREVYILERGWNSIECRVLAPTIQHKRCRVNCECYCEESFVSPFLSAIITKLVNQIARMIFKLSNRSLFSYLLWCLFYRLLIARGQWSVVLSRPHLSCYLAPDVCHLLKYFLNQIEYLQSIYFIIYTWY